MTPKISIIIPVYNTEIYLKECLDSIINQTFKDIEIIIVNDCSPDNSETIILEYMSKDPRIKYIKHDKNKSLLQARITGAKIAIGDYLFHVDSDDYLYTLDALQILSDAIDSTQAEVIQFDIQVDTDWGEWFIPISNCLITDPQKIKDLYFNNIRCSTLWSRIIKRELYLKSIDSIPKDLFINMAEDFTQTPIVMYYANTYIGITDKLYYYRINNTSIANSAFTALKIQDGINSKRQVLNVLYKKIQPKYTQKIKEILGHYALAWIFKYIKINPIKTKDCLITLFLEVFDTNILIKFLVKSDANNLILLCNYYTPPKKQTDPKNKKIGLSTQFVYYGGADRVNSLLMKNWTDRDYKIHLFTCEPPNTRDFPYPESVTRAITSENLEQYESWIEIYQNSDIDTFIVHDAERNYNYTTAVILKLLGKNVIMYYHSDFFFIQKHSFYFRQTQVAQLRLAIFSFIDIVCVLVPYNVEYLNLSGINNVICINNPLTIEPSEVAPSNLNKNIIVWCGRFEQEKNPFATLIAFSQALPSLPKDTKLIMLGDGSEKDNLINFINQHDLSKHIILPGFVDPTPYYQQASLHIMTSSSEAAPMVIAETKAFGVPTLMFELPEISFAKSKGLISVPQNDITAMSEQIIYLLNNPPVLQTLGQDALESLEDFSTKKTMLLWDKMIDAICTNTVPELPEIHQAPNVQNTQILINTLNKHYITKNITLTAPEQQEYHNLQHDKWYNFGQLSRKQKIKKIIIVISKKLKIYPVFKYMYNIIKK